LESVLVSEANQHGLSVQDYALRLLASSLLLENKPKTGAELVEYWQREGVIGSRPEITDSQTHARELRKRAERRS
jgi:hypothetical protein